MKQLLIILVMFAGLPSVLGIKETDVPKPIVVVELFTSQGCSSCPAADKLLSKTINEATKKGQNVFALSFHVDYWNHLGWADPYSDKAYTRRQNEYARSFHMQSLYTPQVVVNGTNELVGSNEKALNDALAKAFQQVPQAGFETLTAHLENGNALKIKYKLKGEYQGCKVNFAIVSPTETTIIKRGENGGRTLRSDNVVRQFVTIVPKQAGEVQVPTTGKVAADQFLVAYIQKVSDHRVIGAAEARLF